MLIFLQIYNMEPLLEVQQSEWPNLRDLFRNNWPEGAVAFCLLDTLITYPDIIQCFDFKVFSPDGDITNGFVATYREDTECAVLIHPLKSIEIMEQALIISRKIDWKEDVSYVSSATPVIEECMKKLQKSLGIRIKVGEQKALKHFLDSNSKQFEISNPPDTYVDNLRPEHLRIVNETWTFHSESSYKFFETLTRNRLTYVLYSTKNDSPLAWITISYEGSLTHLYCFKNHRRKGYAEYILKFAVNDQLNKGKNVLGYTLEKNIIAQKLFDKLNFKRIGYVSWLHIKKEENI